MFFHLGNPLQKPPSLPFPLSSWLPVSTISCCVGAASSGAASIACNSSWISSDFLHGVELTFWVFRDINILYSIGSVVTSNSSSCCFLIGLDKLSWERLLYGWSCWLNCCGHHLLHEFTKLAILSSTTSSSCHNAGGAMGCFESIPTATNSRQFEIEQANSKITVIRRIWSRLNGDSE